MMKLTDTQSQILAAAAVHPHGLALPPPRLPTAPRQMVGKALLKAGLVATMTEQTPTYPRSGRSRVVISAGDKLMDVVPVSFNRGPKPRVSRRASASLGRKTLRQHAIERGFRCWDLRAGYVAARCRGEFNRAPGIAPTRARLEALGEQLDGGNVALRRIRADSRPLPGTRLLREYDGIQHVVTVRADDFEFEGRPYQPLSAIARHITGTRWNGWTFFGLKERAGA